MTVAEMLSRLRTVRPTLLRGDMPDSVRHAAVLCLLYPASRRDPGGDQDDPSEKGDGDEQHDDDDDDDEGNISDLNVVLTLRSSSMRSHAGDVSFPGGRREEGEDDWTAALRESDEEIGFPLDYGPPALERVCAMPHYLSKNNLLVTPCVAFSPVDPYVQGDWQPRRSVEEVQEIFCVRLGDILRGGEDCYEGRWMVWHDLSWRLHQFHLPGLPYPFSTAERKRIWGLTARMLVDIARVAFGRDPAYAFEREVGDGRRIAKALEDGIFGRMGPRERERAEVTGEGQILGETDEGATRTSVTTRDTGTLEQEVPERRKISRRGVI